MNYIDSRAAVEKLERRSVFATFMPIRCGLAVRFDPSKPIEKFVRYWQGMADVD